jgi:Mrp family chromosome partitioning ATPase
MELPQLWTKLRKVQPDRHLLAAERIVTMGRTDEAHYTFDILRTKILKIMRENNWRSIAITSPTGGCGKTVVGLNLAYSLSSLSEFRTVLLDLDLRRPRVAELLGMEQAPSMESFLMEEIPIAQMFVRVTENLAVGANGASVSNAAELLHRTSIVRRLDELKGTLKPDLMLFDLPPMLVNDDALAFLPNVDCVILVVAAEASTLGEIEICERTLKQECNLLGVVLNKCQYDPGKYGY